MSNLKAKIERETGWIELLETELGIRHELFKVHNSYPVRDERLKELELELDSVANEKEMFHVESQLEISNAYVKEWEKRAKDHAEKIETDWKEFEKKMDPAINRAVNLSMSHPNKKQAIQICDDYRSGKFESKEQKIQAYKALTKLV